MAKKPNPGITLPPDLAADVANAVRILTDLLPYLPKLAECGGDCTNHERDAAESIRRGQALLKHFSR